MQTLHHRLPGRQSAPWRRMTSSPLECLEAFFYDSAASKLGNTVPFLTHQEAHMLLAELPQHI